MTMLPNGSADPLAYPRVRLLLSFYVRVPMTMARLSCSDGCRLVREEDSHVDLLTGRRAYVHYTFLI